MKSTLNPIESTDAGSSAMDLERRRLEEPVQYRTRNIARNVDRDHVCTLTFDRPNSSANIFDRATLLELGAHLDWIENQRGLRGLILASSKETIFVAGADLHALASMANQRAPASAPGSSLDELIRLGQSTFNHLEALALPTIAAIHGACVGGGYELTLACNYRIASDARSTKIGLPEIKLGILPAWGGSTRLPRLIGIPKALEVILPGKTLPAKGALELGMIDEVVPRELLLASAHERVLTPPKPNRATPRVSNNVVSAALIRARGMRDLAHKTRGNFPAPFEALDVVTHSPAQTLEKSLKNERHAILRLSAGKECHNLLRLYLLREEARKPSGNVPTISRAAVIGAGVMGTGISHCVSRHGLPVVLRDVSLDQLMRGAAAVASLYDEDVKRGRLTELEARAGKERVFPAATDISLRDVDLVIEAAIERLPLKQDIFRCLAAQTPPGTILATNTSALSVTEIAAVTPCPERVVGLHFFNPVHRMELVEVVAGAKTAPDVLLRTAEFARRVGKLPVIVKDSPGFIVNRILMPYLVEAVRLFDVGANARDIDEVMLDFGMPMGPLRLLDEVGIDVAAHVLKTLSKPYGDRVAAPLLIEKMIEAGMLGKKVGRGFYDHAHDKPNHELEVMRSVHRHAHFTSDELTQRLSLLMVNEAARCVEEHIAAGPAVLDFAMVMGAGYAPFRGGPLRHADALGIPRVVQLLDHYALFEPRFKPCPLLKQMAEEGVSFYPPKGGAR